MHNISNHFWQSKFRIMTGWFIIALIVIFGYQYIARLIVLIILKIYELFVQKHISGQ
jgi:hypothetical protein